MNEIKGRYLKFSNFGSFVYEYECQSCGKRFPSTATEIAEPVLCHRCYVGEAAWNEAKRRRNREASRKARKRKCL